VEYREGDVFLAARKFGLTYLQVKVKVKEKNILLKDLVDDFAWEE